MVRVRILALLVAVAIFPACGGSSSDGPLPPSPIPVTATLGAAQVSPPTTSTFTGILQLTISGDQTSIDFTLTTNVAGNTGAFIRVGVAGVNNTPNILTLANANFTSPLSGTLTAGSGFTSQPGLGVTTFADAVTAILAGNTYVVVTSGGFPSGEIRGQIGTALINSVRLSGAQHAPPVTTAGTGSATFTLNATQDTISYSFTSSGLGSPTNAAHLHFGQAGQNGGVLFTLATGVFSGTITGTLTAVDFSPTAGVPTFAAAVNALLAGQTYVNVHTNTNPLGEIRGQVGAARLASARLSGTQEIPSVATAATGNALFTLNSAQTSIAWTLTTDAANAQAAHLHLGAPGVEAPFAIPFILSGNPFAGTITGTLTSASLVGGSGIASFNEAVDAFLSGALYVNVHTTGNPNGEVRGQVGPVKVASARLSGAQMVPTVPTASTAAAVFSLNGLQNSIEYSLTVPDFATDTIAAELRSGEEGQAGAVNPVITLASGAFGPGTVVGSASVVDGGSPLTFPEAVNALLSGLMFVRINTLGYTTGEVRGQVGPVRMGMTLSGAQEVPANASTATGTGTLVMNGLQNSATLVASYSGLLGGTLIGAHIHEAAVGVIGPIIIDVSTSMSATAGNGGGTAIINAAGMTPANVNAIISGGTYFNVHTADTTTYPNGEIRGQILP